MALRDLSHFLGSGRPNLVTDILRPVKCDVWITLTSPDTEFIAGEDVEVPAASREEHPREGWKQILTSLPSRNQTFLYLLHPCKDDRRVRDPKDVTASRENKPHMETTQNAL